MTITIERAEHSSGSGNPIEDPRRQDEIDSMNTTFSNNCRLEAYEADLTPPVGRDSPLRRLRLTQRQRESRVMIFSGSNAVKRLEFKCQWGECTAELNDAHDLERHVLAHVDLNGGTVVCAWQKRSSDEQNTLPPELMMRLGERFTGNSSFTGNSTCGKVFERVFENARHFIEHTRFHTNTKPYFCPACPRKLRTAGGLKNHLAGEHDIRGIKIADLTYDNVEQRCGE